MTQLGTRLAGLDREDWAQILRPPSGNEIHIWQKRLSAAFPELERLGRSLEPDELERAQGFKFPIYCRRFVAGRGLVREILSQYLCCDAADIHFDYSEFGKPFLAYPLEPAIQFNVAHSDDRLIVAVAAEPIGVDIEVPRPVPELEAITHQVYSRDELASWRGVPESLKLQKFLSLWTRKEALLKGIGLGIANHVKDVTVFFGDDDKVVLPQRLSSENWNIRTFREPDFTWSVAAPFHRPQITFKQSR